MFHLLCWWLLTTLLFISAEDSGSLGNPVSPKPRGLHSSVVLKKDLLVIYGGIDGGASDPYKATAVSDLFVFNLTSRLWYQPTIKNAPTQGYKFSAASNYNNTSTMYVFTGTTSPLLTLDTNNWEWTSTPGPNSGETGNTVGGTMISSGNNLIAYGGVQLNSDGTPNVSKVSDQVQVYDLASRKWMLMPNGNKAYFHSSCVAPGQSEALTFGGASTNGDVPNTLISLSTSAFQFYLNRPSSQTPPPLIGATLSCIGATGILIGGGSIDWKATSSMVQLINNTGGANPIFAWSQPNIKNGDNSPGARIGHSAAIYGDDIYVYGGVGEKDTNVYKLNTLDWGWEVLKPAPASSDKSGANKSTNSKSSGISSIVIIAIVSAIFGILMMGIIIAVFLRHWRQKNGKKSPSIVEDSRTPIRARAWTENKNDSSVRYSSYSVTQTHSTEAIPTFSQSNLPSSGLRNTTRPEEDNECWTETNGSILSGQDDTGSVKPVKYVHPMSPITSPISSNRTLLGYNSNSSPRSYGNSPDGISGWTDPSVMRTFPISFMNNDGFHSLRSNSDIISPLDRIAHLQPSLNNSRNNPSLSKLSSPSSSIQNWPLTSDIGSLRSPPLVSLSHYSPQFTNPLLPLASPNVDPILQKKLSEKYRILASSLTQLRGKVSLIQATEMISLDPVTILLYQDRHHWEKESEMLQILEGPFTPKLKELFVVSSHRDYFIIVHERLGTSLPDILRRQVQPFSDGDLRVLIKGVAQVLQFCHSRGVILADLQPSDFAFAPDNSSRLMLCRTESCLIEGDTYQQNYPPRYCPPEIASAFLNGSDPWPYALPAIDNWGLGCLIYELYARKPILSNYRTEVEALQFLTQSFKSEGGEKGPSERWVDGELRLPGMESLSKEVNQVIKSLLKYYYNDRYTAEQILESPFLARCPSQFSLLATLPHPLPYRCQTGELDQQMATSIVALRRQVVATSEILVPRLVMIMPTLKAANNWKDPATWDGDTFLVYFLCEGAPGLHFTREAGIPLTDPHRFLTRTGPFIAIIAQLCVLYLSPDLLGELESTTLQAMLATTADPDVYFHDLAQLLERYSSRINDSTIAESAQELEAARQPEALGVWLGDWIASARSVLTATRHLALQEVREFLGSESPSHLIYTRPTSLPSSAGSHQPRWLAWLCTTHSSTPPSSSHSLPSDQD